MKWKDKNKEEKDKKSTKEKKRQEQEDKELERIDAMFNAKYLPSLNSGYTETCGYYGERSWNSYGIYKFKFNLNIIKNINNKYIGDLFVKYKKLCEDLIWIQKYVYGNKESKPFVDYIFDYKEKNCIDQETKNIYKKIGSKSREYYYVNYEEFLDLFGTKNEHGMRYFETGKKAWMVHRRINLDSIHVDNIKDSEYGEEYGNGYYSHIFHKFDREKLLMLNFLVDISNFVGIISKLGTCLSSCGQIIYHTDKHKNYYGTGDLIMDHINFIKWGMTDGYRRSKLVSPTNFDDLIKIGKVIVDLVEFIRPEIILMS